VIIDSAMGAGDGTAFWKRWGSIPAVRDGRICSPPTDVITRPGPRVAEGIRLLAECLHPEGPAAQQESDPAAKGTSS
jgi:ABC-type Fe3+-hydroxamate transport system substrate-binding protein